jgi:hypothetical protein
MDRSFGEGWRLEHRRDLQAQPGHFTATSLRAEKT